MVTSSSDTPLAVIGAGPAGLAAALAAADAGIRVTLVDAAPQAGGQFYRQTAAGLGARRPQALHHAWGTWRRLRARLDAHIAAGRITQLSDRQVWLLEPGFTVNTLHGTGSRAGGTLTAAAVVLATGGYEKVLPFPGWTLPGVLTAGGAQAMLKGGLVLPGRTAVVAGTGPLLMPVAAGLAAAGARVAALVESADPRAFVRHTATLAAHPAKLAEGAGYAARLARHRVPVRWRHEVVAAHGTDRVEAVTVAGPDGAERRIACDTLAVGNGMVPHTDLAETLGARVEHDSVAVDAEQRTSVPGLWAAGEATGIGGAELALAEGEIAGRSAAARLSGTEPDPGTWTAAARTRRRLREFFAAIDTVYTPPPRWPERVSGDTLLCRCEEVPASAVREAVEELGAADLRTVKLLTRAGMGWCQGRICAPGVAGVAGCAVGTARRPFAQPVPLGVLAQGDEPRP
ncbi:FAD-dependent oxidoreductase [Streptacidiphilus sp. N1-10]|uniref:FAD-dependent oxidoreductase n=1 Tax=Streptacidiphilus jeojiensis TaxID=3229225 RepID=A0ABV6XGW2_9ACTN